MDLNIYPGTKLCVACRYDFVAFSCISKLNFERSIERELRLSQMYYCYQKW